MPEMIDNRKVFTLLEVAMSIKKTISDRYGSSFWVKAEMNKLNFYRHSGHCYPDLVEKKEGKQLAQMRAIIFSGDFFRINQVFLKEAKEPLKDGITILFNARIIFDENYGLSLRILDIDPSFTLGQLEKEKHETIEKLNREGKFNLNKKLVLPLLPQRIAVISVETSKGYSDFLSVLDRNPWGYKFFHMLFPSILQGEKAIEGITGQLRRIQKIAHHFDAVAIIRGGGGDVGLSCYNDYNLAAMVAEFPLPVLTGIGHSTNETVVELVANRNNITPTELADFLIQKFHDFSVPLEENKKSLLQIRDFFPAEYRRQDETIRWIIRDSRNRIRFASSTLVGNVKELRSQVIRNVRERSYALRDFLNQLRRMPVDFLENEKDKISAQNGFLGEGIKFQIRNLNTEIDHLDSKIRMLDPENVLRRGYSITFFDGKSIKDTSVLKPGDLIVTRLLNGEIKSKVEK
ncbi:MAG: exodeoxyribonuclease VII large subunit [Bacteroidetes bacterium]|nr:exodeoxyribonuclease VII large subunit [Bacteroidota bacterium]